MTMNIAIIHGTSEGQTEKIAGYISGKFSEKGEEAEIYHAKELPEDFQWSDFDGVIIGAPIHAGQFPRYIGRLIRHNRDEFTEIPSAFFSVSLTEAESREESHQELQDSIHHFLGESDWQPLVIGSFAGALRFSQYGFLKRMLMKFVVRRKMGNVDTSRDYEYTDWDSVEEFVDQFRAHLAARKAASEEPQRPQRR